MLKFLVAIDHSVESNFALRAACQLARQRDALVEALHVVDLSNRFTDPEAGWAIHTYKRERVRGRIPGHGGASLRRKADPVKTRLN